MQTSSTHISLLQRLSGTSRDSAAWWEFHARYGELLRGYCVRRGLQSQDADDVVQEVLLSLSRSLPGFRYDPAKGRFRAYLKTAVVRAISRKSCQNRDEVALEDVDRLVEAPDPADPWEVEWRAYHVRRALSRLGKEFRERDRVAFLQYALEGRSVEETAAALAMSVDQVYQAKSRILKRIGRLIESKLKRKDEPTAGGSWFRDDEEVLEHLRRGHGARGPVPRIRGLRDLHTIGSGGQGIVYSGVHERSGRRVAIKVLRQDASLGSDAPLRFEREIDLCRALHHPGIARILGSGTTDDDRRYLVMEYVDGIPLDEYWEDPRPTGELLDTFGAICTSIFHAHQRGIIHRDLKPGNIRVDGEGRPRILDFGLAKPVTRGRLDGESLSSTGDFLGSLPWASPEQVAGDRRGVDVRTDVYSLGVLLYQAVSGGFPYEVSGTLQQVLHNITDTPPRPLKLGTDRSHRDLERIVYRCLQKDPERRYPTVLALAEISSG